MSVGKATNHFLKGGLSDLMQGLSPVEKKAFIQNRRDLLGFRKEARDMWGAASRDESSYRHFRESGDAKRRINTGANQRLDEVNNLFDNPSSLPDKTVQSSIYNSDHIMGRPSKVSTADLVSQGSEEAKTATLARLEFEGSGRQLSSQVAGGGGFSVPAVSPPPAAVAPTNQNIADMLSQFTPEDIARIHRGNVAAVHPGATDELINKLTSEGVGGGPATRLGALGDNERAFNEMLQNRSYRELFGGDDLANYSTKEKQALLGRHEEMLMDELTHPGGKYTETYTQEAAQRVSAHNRLMKGEGYSEAMSGGTNGPIPPSSSNTPINPGTTPTGSTNYSGRYVPTASVDQANEISGLLRPLESDTALGLASSVGMGALLGGSANYAMGGDFTEGAMMGGLAGGAIKIGSRAIQANESGIESYLQRSVLGDSYDSSTAVGAIRSMQSAPEGAGLMQRGAFNVLKSDSASMGMQSRYATIGGSMLSGVAFTGKRNDRRRGFNAHRGNRI
jgi:hypothetical protein